MRWLSRGEEKRRPLRTAPLDLVGTPVPWVNRPIFFFFTGRRVTVACLLLNCCSFLFNRMMSSGVKTKKTKQKNNESQDKQQSLDAGISFGELAERSVNLHTSCLAKISHYSMSVDVCAVLVIARSYLKTCRLCPELSAYFLDLPGGHVCPCLRKKTKKNK